MLAHPFRVVTTVLVLVSVLHMLTQPSWGDAWSYIRAAVHILVSAHWYQLYALRPDIQMGPFTFVVAAPFLLILRGGDSRFGGALLMLLLGAAIVQEARRLMLAGDPSRRWRWLLASVLFVVGWPELALRYGHLDDVLALFFAVLAIRLFLQDRPFAAAVAIGLSADCKPWTMPLAAVLLLGRHRWRALGLAVLVVAAAWGPFLLADPASALAVTFRIKVSAGSTLTLLGLHGQGTPPWCRPLQLLGGAVLAFAAVRRGRPLAAVLVLVAFRMLLDPGDKPYYAAGLLAGTLLVDLEAIVPVATLIGVLLELAPAYLVPPAVPDLVAGIRTLGLVVLLVGAFMVPLLPREGRLAADERSLDPPRPPDALLA